ncbi:MAG TPA: class I SAM-dependent methyltransferase [Verrucomicrobiae bacterium]|nr:class I SAM-dependent methyltransferase [Verrucomicrobiae bacterium]
MIPFREQLLRLARLLVESEGPAYSLRPEVLELGRMLAELPTISSPRNENIALGETRTPHGLALSPTMAGMCMDDFVRTIAFMRGAHAAITDLWKQSPGRPVQFLYAGCGPHAILVLPLMALLPPNEVSFTLVDIHPDSIQSAQATINALGLENSVAHFETVDATLYQINPNRPPDIILVETMQAALEAEPQVAIALHLIGQSPPAVLLPEEVRVDLVLVNPSREFDQNGQALPERDRIQVGPLFVLNRETVKSWERDEAGPLPAARVRLPEPLEARYEPMLFTSVRVYGSHVLKDYDSGLTCPRRPRIEGQIRSGAVIEFRYELGSRPGLAGKVMSRPV